MRKNRQKIIITDFQSIAIIGRGAFGEVRLCRHGDEIVAVKKMKKSDMINKNQVVHCKYFFKKELSETCWRSRTTPGWSN